MNQINTHRYFVDDLNNKKIWFIICKKFNRKFSPFIDKFKMHGICPYCNKNVKKEFFEKEQKIRSLGEVIKKQNFIKQLNKLNYYLQ